MDGPVQYPVGLLLTSFESEDHPQTVFDSN